MARIKLQLPETFIFSTDIRVRITDINYGKHVGNDTFLSLVHEARVRFLNSHNLTEVNIFGSGLVLTDAAIVYKRQVFYGESLKIEVALDDFTKYGCDFFFRITRGEGVEEVALAKTGIVFFDYESNKIAVMPAKFREMFDPHGSKKRDEI